MPEQIMFLFQKQGARPQQPPPLPPRRPKHYAPAVPIEEEERSSGKADITTDFDEMNGIKPQICDEQIPSKNQEKIHGLQQPNRFEGYRHGKANSNDNDFLMPVDPQIYVDSFADKERAVSGTLLLLIGLLVF